MSIPERTKIQIREDTENSASVPQEMELLDKIYPTGCASVGTPYPSRPASRGGSQKILLL